MFYCLWFDWKNSHLVEIPREVGKGKKGKRRVMLEESVKRGKHNKHRTL